jgi:transposase
MLTTDTEPLLPLPSRLTAEPIFYLVRSGCAWWMLPREFSPWRSVYSQFAQWRRDGRYGARTTGCAASRARPRAASPAPP